MLCSFRPDKLLVFPAKDKITVPEETMAVSSEDEDDIETNGVASQLTVTPGFLAHHPRPLAVRILFLVFALLCCKGVNFNVFIVSFGTNSITGAYWLFPS